MSSPGRKQPESPPISRQDLLLKLMSPPPSQIYISRPTPSTPHIPRPQNFTITQNTIRPQRNPSDFSRSTNQSFTPETYAAFLEILKTSGMPNISKPELKDLETKNNQDDVILPWQNIISVTDQQLNGKPFIQNFPCFKVVGLQNCRECSTEPDDGYVASKKAPDSCRFTNFRKLKFNMTTHKIVASGFADPVADPTEKDKQIWLPNPTNLPNMNLETALFIKAEVGAQFQDLRYKECQSLADIEARPMWRKKVPGIRELCDVCLTTIFNYHYSCTTCGFFACVPCYEERCERTVGIDMALDVHLNVTTRERERVDSLNWLVCWNDTQPIHAIQHSLHIAQCIPEAAWTAIENWDACGLPAFDSLQSSFAVSVTDSAVKRSKYEYTGDDSSTEESDDDEGTEAIGILVGSCSGSSVKLSAGAVNVKVEPILTISFDNAQFGLKQDRQPVMGLSSTFSKYSVPHEFFCSGFLLHLKDHQHPGNLNLFHNVWKRGQPVLVSGVHKTLSSSLWSPKGFEKTAGNTTHELVNIATGQPITCYLADFWLGFENMDVRILNDYGKPMLLKLKDFPTKVDFSKAFPELFNDLMESLPLPEYTMRDGKYNLATRLPEAFVRPDMGPKMYIAYASPFEHELGTTNLHLDMSDATNVMTYVGIPTQGGRPLPNEHEALLKLIEAEDFDMAQVERVKSGKGIPGAVWHIYHKNDAKAIRQLLREHAARLGKTMPLKSDPIHDQCFYLDRKLRTILKADYNISGYSIIQCMGDAVFIPAGAPHQVRNIRSCIKIAEDFVSPENLSNCFDLTEEFRRLSEKHGNREDKLQIKNIAFHAMKDAISVIQSQAQRNTSKPN